MTGMPRTSLIACALLCSGVWAAPIRGVNLGGWLVLEPWITPKLFEMANIGVPRNADNALQIVDEYSWHNTSLVGSMNRTAMIEDHWRNWVQYKHLATLKAAGVTHLRIPVGYWYFNYTETEPFASGRASYPLALRLLKRLVNEWAAPLGLQVLIDIHAAPGSQNGFDNSGKRGEVEFLDCGFHPDHLTDCPAPGANFQRWAGVVSTAAKWMKAELDQSAVFGIELLNEPFGVWGVMYDAIMTLINPEGYARVRNVSQDMQVIFQTGFIAMDQQAVPGSNPDYHNVWFDDHNYQCFGTVNDKTWQMEQGELWKSHLNQSCTYNMEKYSNIAGNVSTFVGEWSLAVSDCTKYLSSGINAGCNMTADPSCLYKGAAETSGHPEVCEYYNQPYTNFSTEYKQFLRSFARAQMDSFELNAAPGAGWFFWNFRTEDNHAAEWDFLLGVQEGWIDSDVSNRPPYCAAEYW